MQHLKSEQGSNKIQKTSNEGLNSNLFKNLLTSEAEKNETTTPEMKHAMIAAPQPKLKFNKTSDMLRHDSIAQTRYMDKQTIGESIHPGGTSSIANNLKATAMPTLSPNELLSSEDLKM